MLSCVGEQAKAWEQLLGPKSIGYVLGLVNLFIASIFAYLFGYTKSETLKYVYLGIVFECVLSGVALGLWHIGFLFCNLELRWPMIIKLRVEMVLLTFAEGISAGKFCMSIIGEENHPMVSSFVWALLFVCVIPFQFYFTVIKTVLFNRWTNMLKMKMQKAGSHQTLFDVRGYLKGDPVVDDKKTKSNKTKRSRSYSPPPPKKVKKSARRNSITSIASIPPKKERSNHTKRSETPPPPKTSPPRSRKSSVVGAMFPVPTF